MGRFDALTNLDTKPAEAASPSPASKQPVVSVPTAQPESLKARNPEASKAGLPENSISRKPENLKARKPDFIQSLVAEKYSTQLEHGLIKRIKQYALEHDIKDYEVVQAAVKDYLARNS